VTAPSAFGFAARRVVTCDAARASADDPLGVIEDGAAYEDDYTQGLGSQNLYRLGASATWLLNRNMSLVGAYDFAIRRSGGGASQNLVFGQQSLGQNYTDNRFVLTLRLAL